MTEPKHDQARPSVARILGELREAATLAEEARQAGDVAAELRARGEVRRLAETLQGSVPRTVRDASADSIRVADRESA